MAMKITLLTTFLLVHWIPGGAVDVLNKPAAPPAPTPPQGVEEGAMVNTSDYFDYVDIESFQNEEWCEEGCHCSDGLEEVVAECGARGRVVAPPGGTYLHLYCDRGGDATHPPLLPVVAGRHLDSLKLYDCEPPAAGYGAVVRSLGATAVDSLVLLRPLSSPEASLSNLPGLEKLTVERAPEWRGGPPHLPDLRRWVLRTTPIYLNESTFTGAPPIRWLEISLGKQQTIPDQAFVGLSSLEGLGLFSNGLRVVSSHAFEGLTNLKQLDLSGNDLSSLPAGVFAKCPNLEVVAMFGNNLTLALSRDWWARDAALKNLTVSRQKGQGAPTGRWAGDLPHLQNVWAEGARFTSLPEDSFARSPRIQRLYLNENNLDTLPAHLFRDQRDIVYINLAHNRLSLLPPQLFNSQNKLQQLDLSYNHLETLPDGLFSSAVSLNYLSIRHNKLIQVATHVIVGLDALHVLDLGHNQLRLSSPRVPHTSALNSVTALRELDLTHNYVSQVFDDWRFVMTHLRRLNLTYNNLTSLSGHDLNFLSENVELDVRNNNISALVVTPEDVEEGGEGSGGQMTVWLDRNPWTCDCRLWGLLEALRPRPAPTRPRTWLRVEWATCAGPAALRGLPLRDVDPRDVQCPAPRCPDSCTCTQLPADRHLLLQCDQLPTNDSWPDPATMALSWTSLSLLSTPTSLPVLPDHVRNLTLRNLSLESLPTDWTPPPHLRFLDLTGNRLTALPPSFSSLDPDLRVLLARNPLRCGCANRVDLTRLFKVRRNIGDWEDVVCDDRRRPDEAGSDPCGLPVGAILGVVGALAVVMGAAAVALWKWRGKRDWGLWRQWDEEEEEGEFEYDVFVSFCHADSEWVRREIVERLEPEWRLCVHYRDWRVGDWIPSQITASVTRSRRVLIVVSPSWVNSTWAREELQVAEGVRGGRGVLVLVRGEVTDLPKMSPELAAHYRSRTVLSDRDPRVWSRLRSALPRPRLVIPPLVDKTPPVPPPLSVIDIAPPTVA